MSAVPQLNRGAAALCLAATAVMPLAAQAQGAADSWQMRATIYGYLPTVDGKTSLQGTGGGGSASIDVGTILENLKFTFMGQFEAQKGKYGLFTDVIYLDLGNSKSGTREFGLGGPLPAGASANVDYGLKGWLWTLAGTYQAVAKPNYSLELLAGARMLSMDQTLSWQLTGSIGSVPVADRAGNRDASLTNWDAIVGAKGRASFGEGNKWFVPYYVDLGAGESKFTWQGYAGLGYSFSWGGLVAVWRYIDYDMGSGKTLENLSFNGPAVAVSFQW